MAVDLQFKIPKTSQLWVKWKTIEKVGNGTVKLVNAEMFGPVLGDCTPIEKQGIIFIDLTKHFSLIIPRPYIVKVTWTNLISQTLNKAIFSELLLEDKVLGHLDKLQNKDLLLLDATEHTTEAEQRGYYKAAFDAMLYKETGEPYDFS